MVHGAMQCGPLPETKLTPADDVDIEPGVFYCPPDFTVESLDYGVGKYSLPVIQGPIDQIPKIRNWMYRYWTPYLSADSWDLTEALYKLDRSKSPGLPWTNYMGSTKAEVVDRYGAMYLFDYWLNHTPLFGCTLKDELREPGKPARLFTPAPIESTLAGALLFGAQAQRMHESRDAHMVSVGLQMPGADVLMLWADLQDLDSPAKPARYFDCDVQQNDARFSVSIAEVLCQLRCRCMPRRFRRWCWRYYRSVYASWTCVLGLLCVLFHQKSGQFLTIDDNSLAICFCLFAHAIKVGLTLEEFLVQVRAKVTGDDLTYGTTNPAFDVVPLADTFREWGIWLECSSVIPKPFLSLSFLSTQPLFYTEDGLLHLSYRFLRVDKLLSSFRFDKNCEPDARLSKFTSLLILLYGHACWDRVFTAVERWVNINLGNLDKTLLSAYYYFTWYPSRIRKLFHSYESAPDVDAGLFFLSSPFSGRKSGNASVPDIGGACRESTYDMAEAALIPGVNFERMIAGAIGKALGLAFKGKRGRRPMPLAVRQSRKSRNSQRSRRKKSGGTGVQTFRVPAAVGTTRRVPVPKMGRSRSLRVQHEEIFHTVAVTTTDATLEFGIQPGMCEFWTWLPQIARNFERYKLNAPLIVEYSPSCATTTVGQIGMAFTPNTARDAPDDMIELSTFQYHSFGSAFCPCRLVIPPNVVHEVLKKKMIRVSGTHKTSSIDETPGLEQSYDIGKFFLVTEGFAASANVGRLSVRYDVNLETPSNARAFEGTLTVNGTNLDHEDIFGGWWNETSHIWTGNINWDVSEEGHLLWAHNGPVMLFVEVTGTGITMNLDYTSFGLADASNVFVYNGGSTVARSVCVGRAEVGAEFQAAMDSAPTTITQAKIAVVPLIDNRDFEGL